MTVRESAVPSRSRESSGTGPARLAGPTHCSRVVRDLVKKTLIHHEGSDGLVMRQYDHLGVSMAPGAESRRGSQGGPAAKARDDDHGVSRVPRVLGRGQHGALRMSIGIAADSEGSGAKGDGYSYFRSG